MSDEVQIDTTETPNSSETAKTEADAAPAVETTAEADGGESLVGGAKPAPGEGDAEEAASDKNEDGEGNSAETGPPETYDLKITTTDAEGKETQVELDAALLEKASPLFKEVGLTNDQANKLAPLALEVQSQMLKQIADDHTARIADWAKAVKQDPEIGGAKWPVTEAHIDRALTTFGAPSVRDADGNETNEFRALLNDSGLGNHPVMVKMFANIGKAVGEDDQLIRTDTPKQSKKSSEEVLYPDDVKKVKES